MRAVQTLNTMRAGSIDVNRKQLRDTLFAPDHF